MMRLVLPVVAAIGLLHGVEVALEILPHTNHFRFPQLVNNPIVRNSIHNPVPVQFAPSVRSSSESGRPAEALVVGLSIVVIDPGRAEDGIVELAESHG
jgi:hypothetical protein